jgi:hypothetical protein
MDCSDSFVNWKILQGGGKYSMKYAVVIEKAESNFSAFVPDLPRCSNWFYN